MQVTRRRAQQRFGLKIEAEVVEGKSPYDLLKIESFSQTFFHLI
jgi:hypothetical protein